MKKIITILGMLALCLASAPKADAIKASGKVVEYTQPDGSKIKVVLHGDEFHHWATSEDGQPLALDANKYYRKVSSIPIESYSSLQKRQQAQQDRERQNTTLSLGNHKILVLLIEFKDLKFTVPDPHQAFWDLLNEPGYKKNGGTGSAKDFYTENAKGKFTPEFDVYGPITLSQNYAHYGGNDQWGQDSNPDEALAEACKIIDPELDFSQYDQDGDGKVDNVFFYYAGHNEAEGGPADSIWPHQWSLYYYSTYCDNVRVYRYACTSEYRGSWGSTMCGIGTFCHEFGHVIGLPDFYDTDYEDNGYSDPLGSFSMMDSGSYNNNGGTPPYLSLMERYILGWMGKAEPIEAKGSYTIPPVMEEKGYYLKTGTTGETFLMETRDGTGWDKYIAKGMLIYHVDHSSNNVHGMSAKNRWDSWSGLNCYSDHNCYYINWAKNNYSEGYAPFPGSGNVKTFIGKAWNGAETEFSLYDISYDNGQTTFKAKLSKPRLIEGKVVDYWGQPVEGVTVTASTHDNSASVSSVTKENGTYSIDVSEPDGNDFIMTVEKDGYCSRSAQIINKSGTVTRDWRISSVWDPETIEENKAGLYGSSIGKDNGTNIMAAVSCNATELAGKTGYKVSEISFLLADSGASSVSVLVELGNERVLTRKLSAPLYGGWNTIDVSDENITIPEKTSLWVGFAVQGSKSGKPFAIDDLRTVEGGGYVADYTTGKGAWKPISSGNLMINFTLSAPANPLRSYGFSYIGRNSEGDFVLMVGKGLTPKNVEWKNDGSAVTANVEYTNGTTESLILEL